jgi:hypothetical protein
MRSGAWLMLPILFGGLVGGCGFRVPDIQEVGGRVEGQRFVQAILTNVTCEVRNALNDLHQAYPEGTFIDSWGAQITLTLTTDEKGEIAPGVSWTPPGLTQPSSVFALGAGVSFSADATRTNKINAYHLVVDLQKTRCSEQARPNGLFMLQSDLKLSEWLFDAVSAAKTNTINFGTTSLAVKENVIQHEIKFDVVTSASLTPTWTLTRLTVNPSGNTFSAARTRSHDLLITFGPAVPAVVEARDRNGRRRTVVVGQPSRQAADLHLSSTIATGIEAAVKSALQR